MFDHNHQPTTHHTWTGKIALAIFILLALISTFGEEALSWIGY